LCHPQFDSEGFGEIPTEEFIEALKSPEFLTEVPINKREVLYDRALKLKEPRGPGYISFQEFINVVSQINAHLLICLCFVLHRDNTF
jgi:rhomboid-related protein 1/2/3